MYFPETGPGGGVGAQGAAPYDYDPDNPSTTKFPPYWDGAFFFGEFTRDYIREVRLDSQNRVFKISNTLPCGPVPATATRPWLCDNPMDMEFGGDGSFYLLTYGTGSSTSTGRRDDALGLPQGHPGAGRVDHGNADQRTPAPTVEFTSTASDPDPGDSIRYEWDFDGNGTVDSTDPNPTHTYTVGGQFQAKLTVFDSSGKSTGANTVITPGNTAPVITIEAPVPGGLFAFGDGIPF